MKVVACFLVFAILSTASAQTFSMGNCNKNIRTKQNFDKIKFAGPWYKMKRSYDIHEEHTKCLLYSFNLSTSPKHVYDVPSTYRLENGRTQESIFYYVNALDIDNGKFFITPGFPTLEQPFTVLETDYKTYAVAYSCLDTYQGKLEFAWIISRTVKLDHSIVKNAEKLLKERNIHLKLINVIQNCQL